MRNKTTHPLTFAASCFPPQVSFSLIGGLDWFGFGIQGLVLVEGNVDPILIKPSLLIQGVSLALVRNHR